MLNVQKFLLAQKEQGLSNAQAFEQLTEQFAIKVKHYEDERIVLLDYHQLDSPKMNPIVIECRSLILHFDTLGVISRKFDRFLIMEKQWSTITTLTCLVLSSWKKLTDHL